MTSVLIVGVGPTGLTLACELARRGVAIRLIEKTAQHMSGSRAKGPNPRSLEILEDLGVIDEIRASAAPSPTMRKYRDGRWSTDTDPYAAFHPTPHAPYARAWLLPQWRLEEILRARLAEFDVHVELDTELARLEQHETGVRATLADGTWTDASYLVGCDGGHSVTRTLLALAFDGESAEDLEMVCGDVELDGLERGYWHQWFDEDGAVLLCPAPGTRTWWLQAGPERDAEGGMVEPGLESFQRLVTRHTRNLDIHLTGAAQVSTYRVNTRMVDRYRVGRVLLAGDAAHVQPIAGGLGMNTGIQDAFNLGWKLGMVTAGQAGEGLLDTYEEERLPVAAWTLDTASERLHAAMEVITEPGGGLDAVVTKETSTLGLGYRWSSLSRQPHPSGSRPRAGDRAPDAPRAETPARGRPRTCSRPSPGRISRCSVSAPPRTRRFGRRCRVGGAGCAP